MIRIGLLSLFQLIFLNFLFDCRLKGKKMSTITCPFGNFSCRYECRKCQTPKPVPSEVQDQHSVGQRSGATEDQNQRSGATVGQNQHSGATVGQNESSMVNQSTPLGLMIPRHQVGRLIGKSNF